MKFAGFDWDAGNIEKCQKHGVSIGEIEWVFEHDVQIRPDIAHSKNELRMRAVGINADGRYLMVIFTLREVESLHLVRPISARYMHQREVRHYVETATRTYH
jgi:uncharacterized DUF497 family protein